MPDISAKYMGFSLKSPLICSSSPMTNEIISLKKLEAAGAGAVVLKSLFEEEILNKIETLSSGAGNVSYAKEAEGYVKFYARQENLDNYLRLVSEAKKNLTIPVIASVNCLNSEEWIPFAKKIESAGADALEINIFRLPSDPDEKSESIEKIYIEVARKIKKEISIPVSFKIGYYFSALGRMIKDISICGINGIVLFNRFVNFDIDIDAMKIEPGNIYSSPSDIALSLRWAGIVSGNIKSDVAVSTGIHDYTGLVKALLAGAGAGYIASTLYINGTGRVTEINEGLKEWMKLKNFKSINEFRGKLSMKNMHDAVAFERSQFLNFYTSHSV